MTDRCAIRPIRLRCEFLTDPVGIDIMRPRLSWALEATSPEARDQVQSAYQIVVNDLWDSGTIASNQTCHIEYAGKELDSVQTCNWKVRVWDKDGQISDWSKPARWTMGLLNNPWSRRRKNREGEGTPKWVGPSIDTPWSERDSGPAPILRKSFQLNGPVDRAFACVTALGLYELFINGQRVGDQILAPEWTDYRKRLQYQTYDVTPLLRAGENELSATLAPGWYAGRVGLSHLGCDGARRGIYGRHLRLFVELRAKLKDGSEQAICTDESWEYSLDGPIIASDLLDGETHDARREKLEWKKVEANGFGPQLVAQQCEPVRVTQDLTAVSVKEIEPGVWIFDLGQEIAGRCRFTIREAASGDEIVLRHVEVLNDDGTIYRDNLRIQPVSALGALQEDRYICRGEKAETFEPRFTFHGFRYVEVSGLKSTPRVSDLVGRAIHSDAPIAGRFECSNDLLNRIMRAVVWTQRDNMISVPTDCPQRDERLGWTGDMQVFCGAACFNMDMAAFLAKWLRDIRDAQADDGRMPDFAPHPYGPDCHSSGNPGWGDAATIVAWKLYLIYGDKRILEEMFEPCVRFVENTLRNHPDLIWRPDTRGWTYGDWLDADTLKLGEGWPTTGGAMPRDLYGTAFFAHSADLVARMARVLGREDEARRYGELAESVRAAFNREFVSSQGTLTGETQGGYALALAFDLLPENLRAKTARHLVEALEPYKGKQSTGFQSTLRMMLQLVRFGYHDEAYRLITSVDIPSWGYMVDHGGTTIWERWDGYVQGRGFQNPGMNSFCHYAIGAVGEWMYRVIGGINPDESKPAFSHVIIRPIPGGGLSWAKVSYESIRGTIQSNWKLDPNQFTLEVVIPPNVIATVYLPGSPKVREVGSGTHEFRSEV